MSAQNRQGRPSSGQVPDNGNSGNGNSGSGADGCYFIATGPGQTFIAEGGRNGVSFVNSDAGVRIDLRLDGPQAGAGYGAGATLTDIRKIIGSAHADRLYGDEYGNRLEGGDGNDSLDGGAGDDRLEGGDGNDSLDGGTGDDRLEGGDGNDNLDGGAGDDRLEGGAGNDNLDGGAGDDRISGGRGNDTLTGGVGRDLLRGGQGRDIFYVSELNNLDSNSSVSEMLAAADVIFDFQKGLDKLGFASAIDEVRYLTVTDSDGNTGTLVIGLSVGYASSIHVFLKSYTGPISASDFVNGSHITLIQEYRGNATTTQLIGTNQKERFIGGDNSELIFGNGGDDHLHGNGGDDHLHGGGGDDHLHGNGGHDRLVGGEGADMMFGGAGRDIFDVSDLADTASRLERFDRIQDFTRGEDKLFLGDATEVWVFTDPIYGTVVSDMTGRGYTILYEHSLTSADFDGNVTVHQDERTTGFVLNGTPDDNYIFGTSLADTLNGNDGDDTLNGRDGPDIYTGGRGADIFFVEANASIETADRITDFRAHGERDLIEPELYLLHQIWYRHLDVDEDGVLDTVLYHNRYGYDQVYVIIEDYSEILTGADFSAEDMRHIVEVDDTKTGVMIAPKGGGTITGTSKSEHLVGSDAPDIILGNDGDDKIFGHAGDDTLDGGNGVDILYGGAGDDTLNGGAGDDYFFGDDGDDTLNGGAGDDHFYDRAGRDVMTGGAGRDTFHFFDTAVSVDRANRITDFSGHGVAGDEIDVGGSFGNAKRIWFRRFDADGDGDTDTVLYNNAAADDGVYAILLDYDEAVTRDDFTSLSYIAGTITEIV